MQNTMKNIAIVSFCFLALLGSSSSELAVSDILDYVLRQYNILSDRVSGEDDFISTGNPTSLTWNLKEVSDWTVGFYGGSLWMLYKLTGDETWRNQALAYQERVKVRQFDTSTHDVGFVIMSTFGLGLELLGDPEFIPVIIQAAESLSTRYVSEAGVIRSWNNGLPGEVTVIVDNMMNLELLLKANELTNGQSPVNFVGIVANHSTNTILNHFRADATTFHAVAYNDTNGAIVRRYNVQGFGDDSVWSRGLAWGIHGLTTVHEMMPEEESDSIYLETAEKAAGWFISRLPDDYIPYYDFSAPLGAQYVPRDTSAAAIAAHAFLKLFNITSNSMYFETAEKIMESLISDQYRADGKPEYNIPAILVNGTVFYNQGDFDTSIVYADFYFLRALDLYINITSSRK